MSASFVETAEPTSVGLCSVPFDDNIKLQSTTGFSCAQAVALGVCGAAFIKQTCACACAPFDQPAVDCYYGDIKAYQGDVAETTDGIMCAPWDNRLNMTGAACRWPGAPMPGASSGNADKPWCYTAPAAPPFQIQLDAVDAAENRLCLSYDQFHPGNLDAVPLPLWWAPCANVSADSGVWAGVPNPAAPQLWSVDANSGTAKLWLSSSAVVTATAGDLLVLNERNFGSILAHVVPLNLPAVDAVPGTVTSIRRARLSYASPMLMFGDGGCLGHGLCDVGDGTCMCFSGYAGDNCDIGLNECGSSPCLNGGTCQDMDGRYECKCAAGFAGPNCDCIGSDCEGETTTLAVTLSIATADSDFQTAFQFAMGALLAVSPARVVVRSVGVVAGVTTVAFEIAHKGTIIYSGANERSTVQAVLAFGDPTKRAAQAVSWAGFGLGAILSRTSSIGSSAAGAIGGGGAPNASSSSWSGSGSAGGSTTA